MICPKCHTMNDDEEKFCRNCGFQLNSSRICPSCGKTNDSNSKYCKECGTVLTPVNTFRKQVIEENTKRSFFSMYKIPIICALLIILAIGGVAGMAIFNGNSGGDDGLNTFIPTDNNSGGLFSDDVSNDPTQAKMEENATKQTNRTVNQTNDTNNKTLTEKIENKTDNAVNKTNNTDKSKTLTEKIENKTKELNKTMSDNANKKNDSKSLKTDSKDDSSKTITEKVNKSEDKTIIPGIIGSDDELENDTDDSKNETDEDDELNDTEEDNSSDDSLTEIEMSDVPNLAKEASDKSYSFSTIEYKGNVYTKAQCIYIFSEYILNVDDGKSSAIEIKDFNEAPNPSGEDLSQSIDKADYLSIANRVHSWMDSQGSVPNYVGISQAGVADLSPNKMLKLFAQTTLNYAVTGDLPNSVEI